MFFISPRQKPYLFSHPFTLLTRRLSSSSSSTTTSNNTNKSKPQYRPPSSLDAPKKEHTDLPFDFRYSYTESNQNVVPIGLRDPKYSPFGPGQLQRELTGVCDPAADPNVKSAEEGVEDPNLEEKGRDTRERIQGEPLTEAERKALVEKCQRNQTKRQINLGSDGLTQNMLNDIHNHWKHAEAVRIECLGSPTVDMKNVCTQLEDKSFGKIILRHGGTLILYRGRNYDPEKRPLIPLMLWRPHEPEYHKLIKTTIEGLSIEETTKMRKRGLAVPVLTKLAKNGYYGSLVPMVRDAFLVSELVRIDCQGLERSDYKKIGCKLRDLVPCILVTFEKEQIVVWRGKDYNPPGNDGQFFTHRELFNDPDNGSVCDVDENVSTDESDNQAIRPPLLHHYEDVLRQDLLLKLNYANVMEVPGLREIRVVPKAPYDFMIKSGKLAMESSCGQKFKETQKGVAGKSFRPNPFSGPFKGKGPVSVPTRQTTLRGHVMSNFLVRILTVMSLLDSPVEIRGNSIQFSMETEFCQFSPELEDHFEIFEHIRGFNVTIVTSANTQDETSLLWSGLLQKDDGET